MNSAESATERLRTFLHSVVLNNCIEYFCVEEQASSESNPERVRLFFNAVMAVDGALSYALEAEAYALGLDSFLEFLAGTEPALRAVQGIARSLNRSTAYGQSLPAMDEPTPGAIKNLRCAFAFWLDYARSLEEEMNETGQLTSFSDDSSRREAPISRLRR